MTRSIESKRRCRRMRGKFKAEAHRQSLAVALSAHAKEDQAFVDAVSIMREDAEIDDAIAKIRAIRANAKSVTADEIRAWKHDGHDPRRAGLTSEMPDDLRAIALEGLNQPYEP